MQIKPSIWARVYIKVVNDGNVEKIEAMTSNSLGEKLFQFLSNGVFKTAKEYLETERDGGLEWMTFNNNATDDKKPFICDVIITASQIRSGKNEGNIQYAITDDSGDD